MRVPLVAAVCLLSIECASAAPLDLNKLGDLFMDGFTQLLQSSNGKRLRQKEGLRRAPEQIVRDITKYAVHSSGAYCKDIPATRSTHLVTVTELFRFSDDVKKTQGYLMLDPTNKEIVVAFRGATSDTNWRDNLNIAMKPFNPMDPTHGTVHAGFLDMFEALRPTYETKLREWATANPDFSIVFTGHSLGAALATLALKDAHARLAIKKELLRLFTYGSPRVGNRLFVKAYPEVPTFRAVNGADPTALLPFTGPKEDDYIHLPSEYWFNQGIIYQCTDSREAEDIKCSAAISLTDAIQQDHMKYFGAVMGEHGTCSLV